MALTKKDLETIAAMLSPVKDAERAVAHKPVKAAKAEWSECVSFPYGKGTIKSATRADGLGALSIGWKSVYIRDLDALTSVEKACVALRKAMKA